MGDMPYAIQGKRIRQLRQDAGLTQEEMVDRLRGLVDAVNQSHLSQVERGERGLTPETLAAVATVLETSIDYLMGITDDPTPRGNMEEQVILVERDPERREYLQRIFAGIERMAPERRAEYYRTIGLLYRGLAADSQKPR
jgi:transcriptional regulator with XRE-family HTH domain